MTGTKGALARRIGRARRWSWFVRGAIAFAVSLMSLLWAPAARAQERTFYLDRLQFSGAPDDGLVVWRPYVHEETRFWGATGLGYTLNPLRDSTLTADASAQRQLDNPVQHQLIHYFSAGVETMDRFGASLSLPILWFQSGGRDPSIAGIGGGIERGEPAVHDLRLDGRVKVYQTDNDKLRIGTGVAVWFPTGNSFNFAGDDQVTGQIYGSGEYDFGDFFVAGQLGPHFRPNRGIDNSDLQVGPELRYGVGIFFPLREGELRLGGSFWGGLGMGDDAAGNGRFLNGRNTQLEWMAEVRATPFDEKRIYVLGGGGTRLSRGYGAPDMRLLGVIGIWTEIADKAPGYQPMGKRRKAPKVAMRDKDTDGDGYPDDIDMCPTVKEDGKPPDTSDGCPAAKDRDGDGIPDDEDKCPDDPEDKDGVQDYDGCPEKDADKDGILDVEDSCPTLEGVRSQEKKKHGCPQHDKIIETEGEVTLLEAIQFETGKSTIKKVSYPILNEVVGVLKSRPKIRMAVHGHTDNIGSNEDNMRLSEERAAAVVDYLVSKGIKRRRLESEGFGEEEPKATNATPAGRAKNRRVEFKIID